MKQNVKTILLFLMVFFSIFFMFQKNISADYSGTGGTGYGSVDSPTGEGEWNGAYGFYLRIYNQSDKLRKTIDIKVKDDFWSDWKISALKKWIVDSNGTTTANPNVLYNYLNIPYADQDGDYKKLLDIIKEQGITLSIGDYIRIEPYTIISGEKYTFREIIDSTKQYKKTTCETVTKEKTICTKYDYPKKAEKYCSAYKTKEECTGFWPFRKCQTVTTNECKTESTRYVDDESKPKECTQSKVQTYDEQVCSTETNSYYSWYHAPARILANAAKVGSNIKAGGQTFTAASGCNSDSYWANSCGYESNANIGLGITIVRYEDIYRQGEVEISIRRNDTKKLILTKNATFRISDSTGKKIVDISTKSGIAKYSLDPGNYKVKEINSPQGYNLVGNKEVDIIIRASEVTKQDFFYNTGCAVDLEELGSNPSPQNLLNLYKKYPNNTNLLNFDKPACSQATCNEDKLKNTLGCLSGKESLPTTFNENDLSCYDETVQNAYGNYVGFCSNYFGLTNNLGTSKFYGISGQFLIRQDNNILKMYDKNLNPVEVNNKYVATSKVGKVCYILNGNTYDLKSSMESNNIYFGDVDNNLKTDLLNKDTNVSFNNSVVVSRGFIKYTYELTDNYKLSIPIYLEKITGEYSSTKTSETTDTPIYGILSKFNDTVGGIPLSVPFSVSYGGKTYTSNKCEYETKEEIITYDKDTKGKLDLEFRSIDTNNPFERETNSNWCSGSDCGYDNNIVQTYIKDRNNSYDVTGEGSWYTNQASGKARIVLTPDIIKQIREYNKNHQYDDYELSCDSTGNDCENAFLKQFNIVKVI